MNELHRKKLMDCFEEGQHGVVFVKGAGLMHRYGTDFEFPFRQESQFLYLTGVQEPDYAMLIDLRSGEYHLFAPVRDVQYAVWHGKVSTMEEIQRRYEPDFLHAADRVGEVIGEIGPDRIYVLDEEQAAWLREQGVRGGVSATGEGTGAGTGAGAGAGAGTGTHGRFETTALVDALTDCRLIKTEDEIDKLREAARVNNIAHREVMKALRPGMCEYELKAVFEYHQQKHGLMQPAYSGIHAGGVNSAILHYTDNNAPIRDGELYLIDAGYEFDGYASDVTRTYPAAARFTARQQQVYEAVLEAMERAIVGAVPGAKMEDLHLAAARAILEGLADADVVRGDVDDMMEKNVFALFFPHGLGHFLGLDTHDVGGYPKGVDRIDRPGIRFLRARRDLQPGMVVTIEPGCYFIPALLKPALEDKEQRAFLNASLLQEMMEFGGVRIEDNLVITEDGHENLTDVPKTVADIEKLRKVAI